MKKNLQVFLLVGLGAVMIMAGDTFTNFLPGMEWVGSSYAGGFGKGDAGPAYNKCKEKCSTAYQVPYCKLGCDYSYDLIGNWSHFSAGDAGSLWKKCKDKCGSSAFPPYCNVGCDNYYDIIGSW